LAVKPKFFGLTTLGTGPNGLVVFLLFCKSSAIGVDRESRETTLGSGATTFIYHGVKMSTTAIKPNAKSVFRSIYFCTGSGPPEEKGLHRTIRITDKNKARVIGKDSKASMQYCEQVG